MTPLAEMSATITNDTAEIATLADKIEVFLSTAVVPAKFIFEINLSVDELVSNTIMYGYDDGDEHTISVAVQWVDSQVQVTIEDDGRAFNPFLPTAVPVDVRAPIEDRAIGGLGIHLVTEMMDQVGYVRVDGRNRITLRRDIPDASDRRDEADRPVEAVRRA